MSDWRDGSNEGSGNRDGERKKKKLPVVSRPSIPANGPASNSPNSPRKDWRGNTRPSGTGGGDQERSWTGSARASASGKTSLVKLGIIGSLAILIAVLVTSFVVEILRRDPRLPIIVSISDDYAALDIAENPFGRKSLESILDAPTKTKNLRIVASSNEKVSDEFLREINSNEDWLSGFSGTKVLSSTGMMSTGEKQLKGGGPGKNVTAYFISCRVAQGKNGAWTLLYHEDDPFRDRTASSNPESGGIAIETFLERIGNSTQPNCFAWIVLDIKPPSVITNVSDMEFPSDAFQTALKKLSVQVQDRLILTLPCSQSEENWIAPEFSKSVFAHFFWEGVLNGFDLPKGKITLVGFEKALREKVLKWVALNRHAQQTPKFILSENTERLKSKIILFNTDTSNAKLSISSTNIGSELQTKFNELDQQWGRLLELEYCSQTNPIAYATIESELIQMEDLAESNSQRWKDFLRSVSKEIDVLESRSRFVRRASLIESILHGSVLSNSLFDKKLLKESKSSVAPWLENPPFWREVSSLATANPVDRNVRCLQVWTVLQQIARSNEANRWTESFSAERLDQCLTYIGPNDREKNPEWLEIQFVQILRDALASDVRSDAAVKAIALAIKTFAGIQEIAFAINPELSRWTRKDLLELDALFVAAIDQLVANQFESCTEKLLSMETRVQKLNQFAIDLNAGMQLRDRTIRLAPHILAGLMREFRYEAEQQNPWKQLARELGIATTKAHQLKDALSKSGDAIPAIAGGASATELASLVDRLENTFREFGKLAPNDPESFRRCRTALRWPLLDLEARKAFHSLLSRFYQRDSNATEVNAKGELPKMVHQAPSAIATTFQDSLGEFRDKELYIDMMKRDPRLLLPNLIEKASDSESKLAIETNGHMKSIYMTSYSTRILANSLGQRIFAGQQRRDQWPWNSPSQFSDVNLNDYCSLQAERFSLAYWGDGDLNGPQIQGKYYFERLVDMFHSAAPALEGYDQASPLAAGFKEAFMKTKGATGSARNIGFSSVSVEADEKNSYRIHLLGIDLKAESPKPIAGVSLGQKVRKPIESPRGDVFVAPIPLNSPRRSLEVSQDSLLGEELFVSQRGHFCRFSIPMPKLVDISKLEFKREPNHGSTLRVRSANSDPITLLVLLDCSNSMSYEGLFDKAKSTVRSLLVRIQDLNKSDECKINVGLIAFGRKVTPDEIVTIPKEFVTRDSNRQVYATDVKVGPEIESLKELLKSPWLKESGCTPLYDAIGLACDKVSKDGRSRIVVVSDGSNDIDSDFFQGTTLEFDELREKLLATKTSLFVYQQNNLGFYQNPGKNGKTFDLQKLKDIGTANEELQKLVNDVSKKSSTGNSPRILYDDFEKITKAIEESLPFSKVTITADGKTLASGKFGEDIPIGPVPPTLAQVEIESLGSRQTTQVWFVGNEKFELEYLSQKNELRFIDFDKDRVLRALGDFPLSMKSETIGPLALFARPIPDQSIFGLRFEIAIRRAPRLDEEMKFTRRPAFAVAEILPINADRNATTLISDFNFVFGTHYPVLRTPLVTLTESEWDNNRLDLTVWIADALPRFAKTEQVKDGDKLSVFDDQIQISRVGNKVTAKITSKERFFILCPACRSSTRQLVGKKEQKAEFELLDSQIEEPIEIQIVKLSDLIIADSEEGLQKHFFKSRPFKK